MTLGVVHIQQIDICIQRTITNLGPKLRNLVPDEIKNATPLSVFKSRIKRVINAHVDYVKLLLKILVLLKSAQIYNEIHNSYLSQPKNQIIGPRSYHAVVDNCENSLFGLNATTSEEIFSVFFYVVVVTFVQFAVGKLSLFL